MREVDTDNEIVYAESYKMVNDV